MKNFLFFIFLFPAIIFSQDSSYVINEHDSINYFHESERNYIGLNLSPMVAGLLTNQTHHNIKISTIYKRNFGDHNMRFSLNYLQNVSNSNFDFNMPVLTTDTSIFYRYFNSDYEYYDFRFGFEELRSYSTTRVHIGIDLLIGYGQQKSNYFHNVYELDSSGYYLSSSNYENHTLIKTEGQRVANYFTTGVDVSFGMDIFLSESFLLTIQLTPQFNYYIHSKDKLIEDPLEEYVQFGNFADFKLGYLDVQLIYKF